MRTAAGICAIALGAAGFAFATGLGNAVAGSLPTLTVTTVKAPAPIPTVSVPKVTPPVTPPKVTPPVNVPKAPSVPPPAVPAPKVSTPPSSPKVSVPSVSAPTKATRQTAAPVTITAQSQRLPSTPVSPSTAFAASGGASSSASSAGQQSGGATSSGSQSASGTSTGLSRLRASRPWLAAHGRHGLHAVILTFRLTSRSRVFFTATQVAPACRLAGSFSVVGHSGINRIVFRGRINGRDLTPGTYRISARTPGKGAILHVIIVIVDSGAPAPSDLALARKSDVCSAAARGLANSTAGVAAANGSGTRGEAAPASSGDSGGAAGSGGASSGPMSGTAGETFTAQAPAVFSPGRVAKNVRNPLVIFALAAAIVLLGLAALPKTAIPDPRMTDVLVRHRVEVALAGAAALTAALIALMLA